MALVLTVNVLFVVWQLQKGGARGGGSVNNCGGGGGGNFPHIVPTPLMPVSINISRTLIA